MTDPFTVPVAVRAYCRRVGKRARSWRDELDWDRHKPASRPDIFVAFDTEAATDTTRSILGFDAPKWGWQTQSLLFGVARIGAVAGMRVTDEIIFYPDDLPAHGVELLRRYFEERTIPLGPERPTARERYTVRAPEQENRTAGPHRIWKEEPSVTAWLLPLSEFLKEFYRIAYLKRALVIGFNLPFDFGRLAWHWNASKSRRSVNGWSLTLWSYLDKRTGKRKRDTYKPYITIKKTGPHRAFISFNGRGRENGMPVARYRGEFLDLHTLAFALTNRPYSLASACKTFCGEDLDKDVEHGIITLDYIEYGRRDVKETVKLASALLDIFDHHPVSRASGGRLSETKTYSPARSRQSLS